MTRLRSAKLFPRVYSIRFKSIFLRTACQVSEICNLGTDSAYHIIVYNSFDGDSRQFPMTTITASSLTFWSSSILTSVTVPDTSEKTSFSIFIDSMTTRRSPSVTVSPTDTDTSITVPVRGHRISWVTNFASPFD